MNEPYLEVTFRRDRPVAAYYYLPRRPGEKSCRATRFEPGMVVDYGRSGTPIGIEITAPTKLTLAALNRVLRKLGFAVIGRGSLSGV